MVSGMFQMVLQTGCVPWSGEGPPHDLQVVGGTTMTSLKWSSKMRSVTRCTMVLSVYSLLLLALLWPMAESSRSSQLRRVPGGRRGMVTRVTYQEPVEERVVVHKVHHVRERKKKRRRRIRPVAVVPANTIHPLAGFEGG